MSVGKLNVGNTVTKEKNNVNGKYYTIAKTLQFRHSEFLDNDKC